MASVGVKRAWNSSSHDVMDIDEHESMSSINSCIEPKRCRLSPPISSSPIRSPSFTSPRGTVFGSSSLSIRPQTSPKSTSNPFNIRKRNENTSEFTTHQSNRNMMGVKVGVRRMERGGGVNRGEEEKGIFTLAQLEMIVEQRIKEVETETMKKFDKALSEKKREQYDTYVKVTSDLIKKEALSIYGSNSYLS